MPRALKEVWLYLLNRDHLPIGKTLVAVDGGEGFDLKYGLEPFSEYPLTIFLRSATIECRFAPATQGTWRM
jgi:hypothetical protein